MGEEEGRTIRASAPSQGSEANAWEALSLHIPTVAKWALSGVHSVLQKGSHQWEARGEPQLGQ